MLFASTPLAPICGCWWPLISCFSLEHACPSGLRSPSSFACSWVPQWSVCPHALLHSCHMASPISIWDCQPLPRCPSYWFSALYQHSSLCPSIRNAVFSVPLSADKFRASLFPPERVTVLGHCIKGPGICEIPGRLYLSSVFGIFRPL